MDSSQSNLLINFFKAAGQPDRLKILGLLANQPYSTTELTKMLKLKPKVVTRHIRALKLAELIVEDTVAFTSSYRLNQARLDELNHMMEGAESPPSLEVRTMNAFVVNGRLKTIPHKPEERKVILEWIADKFEHNKRYTETEITELIREFYDKPLTLRRVLADNRFLLHTGRHYWRPIPGRVY